MGLRHLTTNDLGMTGVFGESITTHLTPIVQIDNKYHQDPTLIDDIETYEATGGSSDNNQNLFRCQSGTSLGGYGVIRSRNTLNYRAGQGIQGKITASFTTGVANSLQFAGIFSLTETIAFGYDGADFSVIHEYGGAAEIQVLTVTATGAGTTTVTLDGDSVGITTTAGTVQVVAEELRAGLFADSTLTAKWRFEQINDKVYCISKYVGNKTGTMSVSGVSTVSVTEKTAGVAKTINNIPQSSWLNSTPFAGFDPTKINLYKITFGYLGVASIVYSIYNPTTRDWVDVHVIEWANLYNKTHLGSPDFKIGWTAASLGSTGTNLIVEGGSAALHVEGDERLTNDTHAAENTKGSIATTLTNILTISNRISFSGRYNLGKIKPLRISIDNDHTKGIIVLLLKNPTIAGTLNNQFVDENNSVALKEVAGTTVTGGTLIDGFTVEAGGSKTIPLNEIAPDILPDDSFTIAVRTASGTGATIQCITTWREDK